MEEQPPPIGPRPTSRPKNGTQFPDNKHGQWKKYTDSPGVGSPPPPAPAPSSPPSSRRERRSSPHGSKEKGSKVRGVPQSFGYIKRGTSNGTATPCTNGISAMNPGKLFLETPRTSAIEFRLSELRSVCFEFSSLNLVFVFIFENSDLILSQ